jgi:hypothetical protein
MRKLKHNGKDCLIEAQELLDRAPFSCAQHVVAKAFRRILVAKWIFRS